MEVDDDTFVVIIGDDVDGWDHCQFQNVEVRKEVTEDTNAVDLDVQHLLETAEKHGELVNVDSKQPNSLDEFYEELEQELEDDFSDDTRQNITRNDGHRLSLLKPWQRKSFVKQLRQDHPELRDDLDLLIETLAAIMRIAKAPELNNFCYINNDGRFGCAKCEHEAGSQPAAARHYQEKHGERYLVCYACGVDFRSKTNLYKHEMRCAAPDAVVVLKARAKCVGLKGRNRPYSVRPLGYKGKKGGVPHPRPPAAPLACGACPATFRSRQALAAHGCLHAGRRPHQCAVCGAAYTSSSALTKHFASHSARRFSCAHCGSAFALKSALVVHLDTHLPLKRYACAECGARYSQKLGLRQHERRAHRGLPPPCACQLCPQRFARMSNLKVHMRHRHGMLLMTRNMFFKSLPTMAEIQQVERAKVIFESDLELATVRSGYDTEYQHDILPDTVDRDPGEIISLKKSLNSIESELKSGQTSEENLKSFEELDSEVTEKVAQYIEKLERSGVTNKLKVICIQDGRVVELQEEDLSYENEPLPGERNKLNIKIEADSDRYISAADLTHSPRDLKFIANEHKLTAAAVRDAKNDLDLWIEVKQEKFDCDNTVVSSENDKIEEDLQKIYEGHNRIQTRPVI